MLQPTTPFIIYDLFWIFFIVHKLFFRFQSLVLMGFTYSFQLWFQIQDLVRILWNISLCLVDIILK